MQYLRYSTDSQEVVFGIFVDSTDGNTEETGLTIANTDIKIWKAGTTTLANKNSGGATHISNGIYYATFDATDTNTLGSGKAFIHVSGALYCILEFCVLPQKVYDSMIAGSDNLEVDTIQIEGTDATDQINSACDTAISDAGVTTTRMGYVDYLANATYGLSAIETLVDEIESRLTATRAGYLDELSSANIPADIDTLLSRLTALRAGYIDNLSGGAVALASGVTVSDKTGYSLSSAGVSAVQSGLATTGEAASALASYDPPTNAEMIARTLPSADYFNPASDTVARVTLVDACTTNTDMRGTDGANTVIPPTVLQIRTEIDTNSTKLTDILADTAELQSDFADGGRLDTKLDEAKNTGVVKVWNGSEWV